MKPLTRAGLAKDPLRQFALWFRQVRLAGRIPIPEAMCLSTVQRRGDPDARMVLLKGFDAGGFVFFTNLNSPKARALLARPRAALTFYWDPPGRQVRIIGKSVPVGDAKADAYFATRPRRSQLGAWASPQSAVLQNHRILEHRVAQLAKRFKGRNVPRPANWSGFRVTPERIEFWQNRPYRLNDRFLYTKKRGREWKIVRLYP